MELLLPMGQEEGDLGSTDFRINLPFLFVCLFLLLLLLSHFSRVRLCVTP